MNLQARLMVAKLFRGKSILILICLKDSDELLPVRFLVGQVITMGLHVMIEQSKNRHRNVFKCFEFKISLGISLNCFK